MKRTVLFLLLCILFLTGCGTQEAEYEVLRTAESIAEEAAEKTAPTAEASETAEESGPASDTARLASVPIPAAKPEPETADADEPAQLPGPDADEAVSPAETAPDEPAPAEALSSEDESETAEASPEASNTAADEADRELPAGETEEPSGEVTYVLNANPERMRFHYPHCRHVNSINPDNRRDFYGTRDEAIALGYVPCGSCKP